VGPILLLERESAPGHHATGRSAAMLNELDGVRTLQQIKRLGGMFLREPPAGFTERPLVDSAGVMIVFDQSQRLYLDTIVPTLAADGIAHAVLDSGEAQARVDVLDPASFAGAVWQPESGNLDVHELLSCYLRHARARGVELRCGEEVAGVMVERGRVVGVATTNGVIRARSVVNAAGAWAGPLARMAGAAPIAITPKRRSAVTFAAPDGLDARGWPMVMHADRSVYFEPEGDGFLMSPMDEAPSEACDARPDDLTIAEAMERLRGFAPRIVPQALRRKWAGLRTFAPDRVHVVGPDPVVDGFFWLAGQGGCGIESSPAIGAIAADLFVDGKTERFDAALLSPSRFA
jgi:D-arginine dehydrogenase